MSKSGPCLIFTIILNIIWWMVMITAIVVGSKNLEECPIQPFIPIYLVGLGVMNLLSFCITYFKVFYDEGGCCSFVSTICLVHFHLFTFSWLIAGTVWIYPIFPPNYIPGAAYCDQITYEFAFGITTLLWIFLGLAPLLSLAVSLFGCCTLAMAKVSSTPSHVSSYGATDVGDV